MFFLISIIVLCWLAMIVLYFYIKDLHKELEQYEKKQDYEGKK